MCRQSLQPWWWCECLKCLYLSSTWSSLGREIWFVYGFPFDRCSQIGHACKSCPDIYWRTSHSVSHISKTIQVVSKPYCNFCSDRFWTNGAHIISRGYPTDFGAPLIHLLRYMTAHEGPSAGEWYVFVIFFKFILMCLRVFPNWSRMHWGGCRSGRQPLN